MALFHKLHNPTPQTFDYSPLDSSQPPNVCLFGHEAGTDCCGDATGELSEAAGYDVDGEVGRRGSGLHICPY